ncbi:hypothetical protein KIF24_01785 [Micromonospora sp. Llam7]|uniref:hypothetical protein n=1 Tax=Micromonospora tarapacensis TaxID=2835305 RepID=UPI001C82CD6B|nr:hypothetical protein [Micromonospora tarapacensis]MBX7264905.1 hypothetical protein [Micromonospora tarapacensis]
MRQTRQTRHDGGMTNWFRADSAAWGERIALATAVALTAKGEYDLAVLAHFDKAIAWLFPVMLDVYVITSFHKRRRADMLVALALMLGCQVAVHLVPVFIAPGEEVPWGLVMAVACVAPIVVVRVKMLTGKTTAEHAAEEHAARKTEEVAQLHARAEEADRKVREEAAARKAEETARRKAEETAEAERTGREVTEAEAVRDAEEHAAAAQKAAAEISRLTRHSEEVQASARDARAQAAAASELAARTAGQLEEARAAADRAAGERAAAEQRAAAIAEARQAVVDELARIRAAHDRLAQRVEGNAIRKTRKSLPSGPTARKSGPAVPIDLPEEVPPVPGVSQELAARVLEALRAEPEAKQDRIAELAGTTDRTVRTVLRGLAALPAAIEDTATDRAAV